MDANSTHPSHLPNGVNSNDNIQIIHGDDKSFCDSVVLKDYLGSANVLPAGFNYHVISVFGSQSSGKSTLLNHLFGTSFGVMSETDRRQTTKGIWLSTNQAGPTGKSHHGAHPHGMAENILVLDVEGTDGRERGEDQDFERKSALFALTISEVLMINLWETQVGLYQGANMGLLKTVFEVNLRLFGKNQSVSKSLLLFVIRDFIGRTPLHNLRDTLVKDLTRAWSEMNKPPGTENAKITDYFDFAFVGIPHMKLQETEFDREVKSLRHRFHTGTRNANDDQYFLNPQSGILLPEYHRRIPADGFADYAEAIWDTILSNKDLDLPTQQELLAQFRCDEIAKEVLEAFRLEIDPLREAQEAAAMRGERVLLPNLGPAISGARAAALQNFSNEASRYHKGVFERKLQDLKSTLDGQLKLMVQHQLEAAHRQGVKTFVDSVRDAAKNEHKSGVRNGFAYIVQTNKVQSKEWFEGIGNEMLIRSSRNDYLPWTLYDKPLDLFLKELDKKSTELRIEELNRLAGRIEALVRAKISDAVGLEFSRLGTGRTGSLTEAEKEKDEKQFWDRIWSTFIECVREGENRFTERATSFDSQKSEVELSLWRLRRKSWAMLKDKLNEETVEGSILLKLRENFEEKFRYDQAGIPRIWQPTDDIEGTYEKARDSTLKLLSLLSTFHLNETSSEPPLARWIGSTPAEAEDLPLDSPIGGVDQTYESEKTLKDEVTIIPEPRKQDLQVRFNRAADSVYTEAKRNAIGGITQIPLYFYGLLLALGWNEIIAVISSPIYFAFLLLAGLLVYITYSLNLWGPILRMANAASQQAVEVGKERLREFLEPPAPNRHRMAMPAQSERDIPLEILNKSGRGREDDGDER